MINLTDEMRNLVDNSLANGFPCILASVSAEGEPDIGYKGSMMVFDNESLAYWETNSASTPQERRGKSESRDFVPRHQSPRQLAFPWDGHPA